MHRAIGTSRLVLAKAALIQSQAHIVRQPQAIIAEVLAVPVTAVDLHHGQHGLPLARQAAVGELAAWSDGGAWGDG